MGCVQSIPPENECNIQPLPIPLPETEPDQNANDIDKILSSPGQLTVPESFHQWFPLNHAHKDVSKLFKYHQKLGTGVTGSVFEIEYNARICALKQIDRDEEDGRMLFTTECRVLSKLKHNGIIKFMDMFYDEHFYYLLLEKGDYDLYRVVQLKGQLSEAQTKSIIYSLLTAIEYMHSKNVAHRDLKPENIVFVATQSDRPRIIDFSDATIANDQQTYTEFVGTPAYMSPERLGEHNGAQLKKSDIWAVGVIAYEMYTGQRCFVGDSQRAIFGHILNDKWSWPPHRTPSAAMQQFVLRCLLHDTNERPSATEALLSPWFANQRNEGDVTSPTITATEALSDDSLSELQLDFDY